MTGVSETKSQYGGREVSSESRYWGPAFAYHFSGGKNSGSNSSEQSR